MREEKDLQNEKQKKRIMEKYINMRKERESEIEKERQDDEKERNRERKTE